jgi:hypothetical protein
VHTFGVGSGAD